MAQKFPELLETIKSCEEGNHLDYVVCNFSATDNGYGHSMYKLPEQNAQFNQNIQYINIKAKSSFIFNHNFPVFW